MKLNRRQFTRHATANSAALVAAPFASMSWAQSNKIRLGQSCPLTGNSAQLGIQFKAGAKCYFDALNAKGGVGGRTIELTTEDDGYDPARCFENTTKFINQNVLALFGYVGTPTSLAALPLFNKANIPFIAPLTGAMSLREPFNKLIFHLRASYDDETATMVKQLESMGQKNIAVFYQNDAYGKAGLDGATRALAKLGNKPVAVGTVERNSLDISSAIKALIPAKHQAIIQVGSYRSCAAFVREARKAGFGGQFFNVSFVGTSALSDELGKDGVGVVVTQVVPSPYNSTPGIAREFQAAVKADNKFDIDINYSSFEGYLAAKFFVDGLSRAGSKITSESIIAGMQAIGRSNYGGFQVNLSSQNHVASSFVEQSMLMGEGKIRV